MRYDRNAMIERFHRCYDTDPDSGCWLWRQSLTGSGYPQWSDNGKNVMAHRWAYQSFVGPIPEGYYVGHKCDVKRCVNPSHLEAITPSQNTKDAYGRGLFVEWKSKLTHCPKCGSEYRQVGKQRRCLECQKKHSVDRQAANRRSREYRARKKEST